MVDGLWLKAHAGPILGQWCAPPNRKVAKTLLTQRHWFSLIGLKVFIESRSLINKETCLSKKNTFLLSKVIGELFLHDITNAFHTSTKNTLKKRIIGGWGVLNREIVSFRSFVRTRGLVA